MPIIAFLTSPIGLLVGAFVALLGVMALVKAGGKDTGKIFGNIGEAIKDMATKAVDFVLDGLSKIIDMFVDTDWAKYWDELFSSVSKVLSSLVDFLGKIWDKIVNWYGEQNWDEVWEKVMEFTAQFGKNLSNFLAKWLNKIIDWAKNVDWSEVWEKIFTWTHNLHVKAAQWVGQLVGSIVNFLEKIDWGDVFAAIVRGVVGIGKGFLGYMGGRGTETGGIWGDLLTAFMKGYRQATDFVITPQGSLIKTSPDDYLFGTKEPGGMGGGATYNVTMNIRAEGVDVDELKDRIGEEFVREIESKMRR